MAKKIYFILIAILLAGVAVAQPNQQEALAQQYYQAGEYSKAADIYEELFEDNPNSTLYYRYLYNSLIALKEYDRLEKVVKKLARKNPGELSYVVDMGYLLQQAGDTQGAKKAFEEALERLSMDEHQARRLANSFVSYREFDYAIQVYQKLRKEKNNPALFGYELAGLYEQKNDTKSAINSYLDFIENQPANIQAVKNTLQRKMDDDAYSFELQSQLYSRIQKNPQMLIFPDLLIWLFIQQKDFESAFIQVKALDKRLNENGIRVLELARSANREEAYDASIKAYEYIINEKGQNSSLYWIARQELLNTQQQKIVQAADYTKEDLLKLEEDYLSFLTEFGSNPKAYKAKIDLARLEAFYLHDIDTAIIILEDVLQTASLNRIERAEVKLDLGDFYLLKDEIWESTLLYSQVDKDMRDEPLGEKARFKNAKLSYYKGEFEWAQAQLEILKGSTSELIANDAIDLSVFIMDNLGLDTTVLPMLIFAKADLYIYQNKFDEALAKLDSLTKYYPRHSLTDDILFAKARIAIEKRNYVEATGYLGIIAEQYSEDILGDNAIFLLAQINERQLGNNDMAMQYYEELIINHSGSVYIVEARKRYRHLRGDQFN